MGRCATVCIFFPNLQNQSEIWATLPHPPPSKQETLRVKTQGASAAPQSQFWGCRPQHTSQPRTLFRDGRP